MTEREKLQKGLLYDANNDVELLKLKASCKEQCFNINQLSPEMTIKQKELLSDLLGQVAAKFTILAPFYCD